MSIKTEHLSTQYVVTITAELLKAILHRDMKSNLKDSLYRRLNAFKGVSDVEYSQSFGTCIWYYIYAEDDSEEVRKQIEQTIIDYAIGTN